MDNSLGTIYTHLAIEYFQPPKAKACQNAQTFIEMKRESMTSSFATKKQTFMDWTAINFVFHLPHTLGEMVKIPERAKLLRLKGDIQKISSQYDVALWVNTW